MTTPRTSFKATTPRPDSGLQNQPTPLSDGISQVLLHLTLNHLIVHGQEQDEMFFARNFDVASTKASFDHYWYAGITADVLYVLIIMFGKKKLAGITKNKVLLDDVSLIWNAFNACVSVIIFLLTLPEFVYGLMNGYHYTVCTVGTYMTHPLSGFGQYLFVLSKFWELGDTIILMLKGRPIIFLHSYHHAIVLFQTFYSYPSVGSFARLGTFMNAFVHTVMYSYFVTTALVPSLRRFNIFVTLAQLLQFFVGVTGIIYGLYVMYQGGKCDSDPKLAMMHLFIYASFLGLFAHFFYNSYITKTRSSKDKKSN